MSLQMPPVDCLDPYTKCSEPERDLYAPHHLHVKSYRVAQPSIDGGECRKSESTKNYFCDWYPKLFGIDEDEIPLSDYEEGLFDLGWSDLEDQAMSLTDSELDRMRVGPLECLTDDELRQAWLREQRPRYGRRAREKQTYVGSNNEPFECICAVDNHYERHYVPNFGGGVPKEGEEFKIPHFKAFWEDFKERREIGDMERLSNIFKPEEEEEVQKTFQHPTLKFKDWNQNKIKKMRKELLDTFRPLHCREVRRYRMPYSEALYLELQEDECQNAAAFFKHLIIKDYFVHKASDNFGVSLRDSRYIMNKLFTLLKLGERYSKREEYHKETYLYLRTGKHFNDCDRKWWWLAEAFYERAVKVSRNCVIDGGKAEAISNYILGMFLLDCVDRVQAAQEHLLRARELSMGKDWSARSILQKYQDTVHKECATYLSRALIAASKELRKNGKPEEALPLIHRSYKLCEEVGSSRSDIEMETYFELGMTYQAVGMLDWAKVAFRKFIGLAEMQDFVKGICDGYLELAICYRSEGDMEKCYRNITNYLLAARAKEDHNLMAFGNRYLGEFLLNSGNAKEGAFRLHLAFNSFLVQYTSCGETPFEEWQPEHFTLHDDVELTRVLVGLAEGEMLTKAVSTLILALKDSTNEKLQDLITWKNTGDKKALHDVIQKIEEGIFEDLFVEPDEGVDTEVEVGRNVHFAARNVLLSIKKHTSEDLKQ